MIGAYDSIMKADAGPELRHLRALRAVAEEGSFAGAAAVLGCSQPAVSQQIAQLETHLGVPVLHRRPLRPTDAGRVLLAAGDEVVTVLAAAQAEIAAISEGEAGEVRVGAFDSACTRLLPTALRDFRQTFPGGQVVLVECETTEAHSLLLSGELDIAVTFDYNRFPVSVPRGANAQSGRRRPGSGCGSAVSSFCRAGHRPSRARRRAMDRDAGDCFPT